MIGRTIIITLAVFLLLAIIAWFIAANPSFFMGVFNQATSGSHRTIHIGGTQVSAEIADTDMARVEGLSGRTGLTDGTGLLMIFDTDGTPGIWMKDMKFAIDIVWIDKAGSVVTVAPSVGPETYPSVYYPDAPSRYVLEVPAGFSDIHNLKVGDHLVM